MARILFLGTSNANPHPDRLHSGIMLDIDSNFYLFDCGDGIPSVIWNREDIIMNFIHCVFISHYHPDHVGGLMAFHLLMHQRIKKSQGIQPGTISKGLSIFLPTKEGTRLMAKMTSLTHGDGAAFKKKFLPYSSHEIVYEDEYIKVKAFPTKHTPEAHGFIIEAAGKKILYSGDTKHPSISARIADEEGVDIVIHELAHFDNESLAKEFKNTKISDLIIIHMQDNRIGNQDKVMEDLKAHVPSTTAITIAHDGLEFELR